MSWALTVAAGALMAMLHHEIDGNSTDGLKESYNEIQRYLIEK